MAEEEDPAGRANLRPSPPPLVAELYAESVLAVRSASLDAAAS